MRVCGPGRVEWLPASFVVTPLSNCTASLASTYYSRPPRTVCTRY